MNTVLLNTISLDGGRIIKKGGSGGGGGDTPGGGSDIPIIGDGKTYLYIKIAEKGRMNVPLYFSQTVANGVTIDWGDGSATQTLSGTGNKNTTHTYADVGEYVISLNPADGCTLGLGHASSSYCVMGGTSGRGIVYCNMLQAVEIGKNITSILKYAFQNCYSLASVVIGDSVTRIDTYAFSSCYSLSSVVIGDGVIRIAERAFYNCYSLASVVIPNSLQYILDYAFANCYSLASVVIGDSVISIGVYAFQSCSSLASVVIGDSVTTIKNYAFSSCYSLANVEIPNSVTNITMAAFQSCNGMAFYDFSQCTSVPSVSSDTFQNIPSDCKIVVPDSLYDTWIAATNWSSYASYIVKASEFNA